ncbi:DUF2752 domain-containing protein [Demequina sp. NBRC 110055]|uniref:DUF2752 domain-containing protein n=1 Tax=Demequina sp. NBRC 110055 TaxID=1570344 RepID=UPI000A036F50|nr:DUF2752 domain-containing protein [Demequina sp. NBRC 110055]
MTMADAVVAQSPPSPGRRLAAPLAASAIVTSAAVYTALANPYQEGFFPSCMWLSLTGHWCPGCGGLRAVHELAHGDVGAALALNPVAVLVVLPLGIALLVAWLRAGWQGRSGPRIPMWVAIALPVVFGAFWIARNIPALEPFLAP